MEKIPSLNGLRAFSIICVLIAHVEFRNLNYQYTAGGQIGVTIFFVISGFLITYLLLKEEATTGSISLSAFFLRRATRIFPVFYFLLLVYFILQLAGLLHIERGSWLSSLTYTKYFFVEKQNDWETIHFWSLSVEEHFYLIWPLVFRYGKKYRNLFVLAVIVAVPLIRLMSNMSAMNLFTRADAIMWGCFLAINYKSIQEFVKARSVVFLFMPFVMILLCLASKKLLPNSVGDFRNHILVAFLGSFGTITNISICFIIVVSIEFRDNIYFAFINGKAFDYLGKISYSVYIWQQLFFSESVGFLSKLPINLICIFIVAIASYRFIEQPFLRLKKHFGKVHTFETNNSLRPATDI